MEKYPANEKQDILFGQYRKGFYDYCCIFINFNVRLLERLRVFEKE